MSSIVHTIRLVTSAKEAIAEIGKYHDEIVGCAQTVEKYANTLSGDRIFKSANEWAAAVAKLGGATDGLATSEQLLAGASKLTAAEKEKLNRTVSEAIDKYEALGHTAPAALRELQTATVNVNASTETFGQRVQAAIPTTASLTNQVQSMALGYITGTAAIAAFEKAFRLAYNFVVDSVKAYTESEDAQRRLTAALTAAGLATPRVIAQFSELAEQYQRTTVYSDEMIKETEALLVQVGGVMPGEMNKALRATTDLASGLGIDLRAATMLVSKSFEDNFAALKKAGVIIDETRAKAEGIDYVLGQLEQRFGGQAQSEAESYAGQVKQLGNEYDDLQESVGKVILDTGFLQTAMAVARVEVAKQAAEIRGLVAIWGVLKATLPGLSKPMTQTEIDAQKAAAAIKALDDATLHTSISIRVIAPNLKAAADASKQAAHEAAALTKEWAGHIKPLTDTHVVLGQIEKRLPDVSEAWREVESTFAKSAGGIKTIMADTKTHVVDGWKDVQKAGEDAAEKVERAQKDALKRAQEDHDRYVKHIEDAVVSLIDGAIHGWDSLKQAALNIGNEILTYYEHVFVRTMLEYFGLMEGSGKSSFAGIATSAASVGTSSSTAATVSSRAWATSFAATAAASISWAATAYMAWQWYSALVHEHFTTMPTTPTAPDIPGHTEPGSGDDWAAGLAHAQALWDQASATGWAYGSDAFYSWMNEHPEFWNHGVGFRGGTHGQYRDFGMGTPVMLHGRERVMTEAEGRREARGGHTFNVIAWDGQSVDTWLRRGGDRKLSDAVALRLYKDGV